MAQRNTRLARQLLWFAAFVDAILLSMMLCVAAAGGDVSLILALGFFVTASVGFYAHRQGLWFEFTKERTWNAVCSGLGGSFAGVSVQRIVNPIWFLSGPLLQQVEHRTCPRLRDVYGTDDSWTGTVIPFAGQTVEEYNKESAAFAQAFCVPFVTFSLGGDGTIRVRAGDAPIPEIHNHPGRHPLSTIPVSLLERVPMARDIDGKQWYMPVEGQHILIAARTGGGKGSWIWSLVLGLAPVIDSGRVILWGCDPKRLELAIGRSWWHHYADSETAIVDMLERCVSEMLARALVLQGRARKFTPSREMPLNVIVVDELGYLSTMMPDKKLRDRAERAISTILALGRALGYCLVGAVQDPRKETVSFRDLFPVRIAGGLPAPMVDLVLGEGMHDAGAYCEQIPLGNAGAGVAYVMDETSLKPLCVRAAWCDDLTIRRALLGNVQPAHNVQVVSRPASASAMRPGQQASQPQVSRRQGTQRRTIQ